MNELKKDSRVMGALYDFLGFLTTREETIKLGGKELVPPVIKLLREWCANRNIDPDCADVLNWNDRANELDELDNNGEHNGN